MIFTCGWRLANADWTGSSAQAVGQFALFTAAATPWHYTGDATDTAADKPERTANIAAVCGRERHLSVVSVEYWISSRSLLPILADPVGTVTQHIKGNAELAVVFGRWGRRLVAAHEHRLTELSIIEKKRCVGHHITGEIRLDPPGGIWCQTLKAAEPQSNRSANRIRHWNTAKLSVDNEPHYIYRGACVGRQCIDETRVAKVSVHGCGMSISINTFIPRAVELIQDLENRSNQLYKHLNPKNDSFSLRLLFAEWIRVCRINTTTNTLYKQFAQRIASQVSSSTDRLCFFFRLSTETCIELYQPSRPQSIDAYTKLIGYMVRLQESNMAKIKMISHVLSVIVLVIAHQHENQNIHFNQKPFLKLLSSLFIELNNATNRDKHAHAGFITVYR